MNHPASLSSVRERLWSLVSWKPQKNADERSDFIGKPNSLISSLVFSLLLTIGFPLFRLFAQDSWTAHVEGLIEDRKLAAAENMIVERLVASPRDPVLITLLAEIRFDQKRYQEVQLLLRNANDLGGPSAKRATLTGLVAVVQRRMDLAEPKFQEAIQLDPKYAPPHYYLSRLLYTRNHFDEAIQEGKATLARSPDFVRAYENLGLCYEGKQDFREAQRWYLEAIRRGDAVGRQTAWPFLDLAAMLIRNGRAEGAKPYLLRALTINPRNAESHFQMGYLLEKEGDLPGALKELQAASELDPAKPEPYYRAGRIYQRLGEREQAEKEFEAFRRSSESKHNAQQRSVEAFAH